MLRTAGVASLVSAACFVLPATAMAQEQTLGNPLTSEPNAQFGCETQPRILDSSGTWYPTQSGVPDCTWWHTAGNTVPGNGTIQKVTIKSGPNPADIRFVVLRTLASGGQFCCFFVAESSIAKPAPNSRQSFIVNFPVERNTNTNTGTVTQDTIGFSAVSGTGTLPIADNGQHNALDPIDVRTNASWYYPRLSSATDTGSGRRPDGSSNGFEVLLQTTFCPAGQTCAGGTGGIPLGGTGVDRIGPVVGRPVFNPNVFRVGGNAASLAARVKRGSKLRFTLSEAATATIKIQRRAAGRRKGKSCVAPTRKLRKAKKCKRWKNVRTLTRTGLPAGKVVIPFSGRFGKKALKPRRYRAAITAKDAAGNASKVASAKFRIVR